MSLRVAGLFAGIGGLELGFAQAGHHTGLLVENFAPAAHVLATRFPGSWTWSDVRELADVPEDTDVVTAGFPCQDLSSVGRKSGIDGAQSSLVGEVLRLLRQRRVPWVVLENVPFLVSLDKGRALTYVTDELTALGYRWAYRVLDSRAFGLPQRRNRWFLVASIDGDPRAVLLHGDETAPPDEDDHRNVACGFYWTEGVRALGWAYDAVPPIKCGSSVGVASPPAIRLPDGSFVTPDIRDAERLQGFPSGWTEPALEVARRGERWRLVGNAVSVPVARWIGERLTTAETYVPTGDAPLAGGKWPRTGAWRDPGGEVHVTNAGPWPVWQPRPPLHEFLSHSGQPLSRRAAAGFLSRMQRSSLRSPPGLLAELDAHVKAATV